MLEKKKWSNRRPGNPGDCLGGLLGRATAVAIVPPLGLTDFL